MDAQVGRVLDALDPFLSGRIALGNNAVMYVEPTRALVAVDVNTGRDTSLAAGTKANLASALMLPRALRVKGLGGQITLLTQNPGFSLELRLPLEKNG